MLQTRIRIDGREHFIPSGDDVEAIMRTITEQARAGGGFVEIVRVPDRVLRVFVSPGMNLSIEVTHVEDQFAASDAEVEPPLAHSSFDTLDLM